MNFLLPNWRTARTSAVSSQYRASTRRLSTSGPCAISAQPLYRGHGEDRRLRTGRIAT